jgi:hypothetical protein
VQHRNDERDHAMSDDRPTAEPHRAGPLTGRLKALAVAGAGVLLAVAAAGCGSSSGGGWKPPGKGQAGLLVDYTKDASRLSERTRALAYEDLTQYPHGIAATSAGNFYLMAASTAKVEPGARVVGAPPAGWPEGEGNGVAALPDGSFVVSVRAGTLWRVAPNGTRTVLSHAFKDRPVPFGARPDGTLLVGDGGSVWTLAPHKDAKPTRIWHTTAKSHDSVPLNVLGSSTVDADGTAYVTPQLAGTSFTSLSQVTAIHPNGMITHLKLPARVTGLSTPVDNLDVGWLTPDGGSGLYAEVFAPDGPAAVLHLHGGHADLVAAEKPGTRSGATCDPHRPFSARAIPCPLPAALTYTHGKLYLAGTALYVMEIPVP